jgi:two-component system chemotaxis response regulator CheB
VFEAVVIGVSAGGLKALTSFIPELPGDLGLALIIVQHVREGSDDFLARHLNGMSAIRVKEADEKEPIQAGTAYLAPPGYHLLVEDDRTFSLSAGPFVSFSRPSVDVLFDSAAHAYGDRLVGVILTGANSDGALGLAAVKQAGGVTIVQNPDTADTPSMPKAAIRATTVDHVLTLAQIAPFLASLPTADHASHSSRSLGDENDATG